MAGDRDRLRRGRDFARFRDALAASEIGAVLIQPCTSSTAPRRTPRSASGRWRRSPPLVACRRRDRRARRGRAPRVREDRGVRPRRSGGPARSSPRRSRSPSGLPRLHLENTAGAGGTLGRSFAELAALLERGRRRSARSGRAPGCPLPSAGLRLRTSAPRRACAR